MDIADGTDTRTRIVLSFTREEFDDLCDTLTGNCFPTGTAGKILRFRGCFTDRPAPSRPAETATRTDDTSGRCGPECSEGHTYVGRCQLVVKRLAGPTIAVSQEDLDDWKAMRGPGNE